MNGNNNPLPEEVKKSIDSSLEKGRTLEKTKKILFLSGYTDNALLLEAEGYYNSKKKSIDPSPSAVNVVADSTVSTSGTVVQPEQDSGDSDSTVTDEQNYFNLMQRPQPYTSAQAIMQEGSSISTGEVEDLKAATTYDPTEAQESPYGADRVAIDPFSVMSGATGGAKEIYETQDDPRTPGVDESGTEAGLPGYGVDPDLDATYLQASQLQDVLPESYGYQINPANILQGNIDPTFAGQINELQIIAFDEVIDGVTGGMLRPATVTSEGGGATEDPSGFLQAFGDFDMREGVFEGVPAFQMFDEVLDRVALLTLLTQEEAIEFMSIPAVIDEDFLRKIASSRSAVLPQPEESLANTLYLMQASPSAIQREMSGTQSSQFNSLKKKFEQERENLENQFHDRVATAIREALPITARDDIYTLKNIEQFLRVEHNLSFDLTGEGKVGNRPFFAFKKKVDGSFAFYGDGVDAGKIAGLNSQNILLMWVELMTYDPQLQAQSGFTEGSPQMDLVRESLQEERRLTRAEVRDIRKRMNEYTQEIFEAYSNGDWGLALERSLLMSIEAAPMLAATTTAGFFGGPVAAGMTGAALGVAMEADRLDDEIFLDKFIDKETGEVLNYNEALNAIGLKFQFGQPSMNNRQALEERFDIQGDIFKKSGYLGAIGIGEFAMDYTLFRALSGAQASGAKASVMSWLAGFAIGYGRPLAENGLVTAYASIQQEFLEHTLSGAFGEFDWDAAAERALNKVAGGAIMTIGMTGFGRAKARYKNTDALSTNKVAESPWLLDGDALAKQLEIIRTQRARSMRSGFDGEAANTILNSARARRNFLTQQNADFLNYVGSRSKADLDVLTSSHWVLESLVGQYRRAGSNRKIEIKEAADALIKDIENIRNKYEADFKNREVDPATDVEGTQREQSRKTEDQQKQEVQNQSKKPADYDEQYVMGRYLNEFGFEGLGFVKDTDTGGYLYTGIPVMSISRKVARWWTHELSPTGGIGSTGIGGWLRGSNKYTMPDGTVITLSRKQQQELVSAMEKKSGIRAADQDELIAFATDFRNLLVEMRFGVETTSSSYTDRSVLEMYSQVRAEDVNALRGRSSEEKAQIIAENRRRYDEVSDVLAGKKKASDLDFLNPVQQKRLTAYREVLDAKSTALVEILKSQNSKPGRTEKQIKATNDLIATIEGQRGTYLNRSYKAFSDDGDIFNQVLQTGKYVDVELKGDVKKRFDAAVVEERTKGINNLKGPRLQAAANKAGITTRGKKVEQVRQELAEYNVMQAIRQMSEASSGSGFRESIISTGGKVDMLRSRTLDQRPEFRRLLGEVEDPILNFVTSVNKINQYVATSRSHQALFDALSNAGIVRMGPQAPPGGGWKKLEPNAPDWSPIKDVWVRDKFKQGYDAVQPLEQSAWKASRFMQYIAGQIKIGKTVFSPTTQFRNLWSGIVISTTNGHPPFSTRGNTVSNLAMVWDKTGKTLTDANWRAEKRMLIESGVLKDGANAGELMDTLRDFRGEIDIIMKQTGPDGKLTRSAIRQLQEMAQKCYRFGDDYFKVNGYYIEKNRLIDAGFDEATAHNMASRRIKDCYPTYSKIPRAGRQIRRSWLFGDFVSFSLETVRTQSNIIKYGAQDIYDGTKNNRPQQVAMGIARLMGLTTSVAAPGLLNELSRDEYNITDDMDLGLRVLAGADWNKNSKFVYMGKDESGNPEFIDATFVFPTEYTAAAVRAALEGDPREEGYLDNVVSFIKQAGMPFGPSMVAQGLLWGKEEETGFWEACQRYSDPDSAYSEDQRLEQFGIDVFRIIESKFPGFYSNIREFARANEVLPEFFGEKDTPFKSYDNGTAGLAIFGLRHQSIKLDQSAIRGIDSKIANFQKAKNRIFDDILDGRVYDIEDLDALVEQYFEEGSIVSNRIANYIDLIMAFRPEDGEEVAAAALKASGVRTDNYEYFVDAYMEGAYSNYALAELSPTAMEGAIEKQARSIPGFIKMKVNKVPQGGGEYKEELEPVFKTADQTAYFEKIRAEIVRVFDYVNEQVYQMNEKNPIQRKQTRTSDDQILIFPEDGEVEFQR